MCTRVHVKLVHVWLGGIHWHVCGLWIHQLTWSLYRCLDICDVFFTGKQLNTFWRVRTKVTHLFCDLPDDLGWQIFYIGTLKHGRENTNGLSLSRTIYDLVLLNFAQCISFHSFVWKKNKNKRSMLQCHSHQHYLIYHWCFLLMLSFVHRAYMGEQSKTVSQKRVLKRISCLGPDLPCKVRLVCMVTGTSQDEGHPFWGIFHSTQNILF